MPIVHAPVQLTVDHLIAAVKQLPSAELHKFEKAFSRWQKSSEGYSNEEAELLTRINADARLSAVDQRRYERLRRKHEGAKLTEREQTEYQSLLRRLEACNAKRLEALLQLAQKRGTTLHRIMKALGLPDIKDAA